MKENYNKGHRYIIVGLISIICLFHLGGCEQDSSLRLNHIQLLGSHNSYKQRIQRELWDIMYVHDSVQAMELDYGHISLTDQLNIGIRGLELDVYYDPMGGRFASPQGQNLIKEQGAIPQTFDTEMKMKLSGLKVFHIQDLDFRSHCLLFKEGLLQLKEWSQSHKNHLPIIITINAKDQLLEIPVFTNPLPFDSNALNSIDKEILSVFDQSHLITPDFVRGNGATLEKAILTKGWPTIKESKGKFMFILDERGKKKEIYLKNHPSLKNRVMFTISPPANPESAFLIINNPIIKLEKIKNLIKLGYIVRTRADAGTWEARNNDYNRWEAALESGAQLISTDYYVKDTILKTGYQIKFQDGGYYRSNPLFEK